MAGIEDTFRSVSVFVNDVWFVSTDIVPVCCGDDAPVSDGTNPT